MNKNDKSKLLHFAVATVLSLVLLAFYYFSMNFTFFPIVMISYMVALAVLAFINAPSEQFPTNPIYWML